VEDIRKCIAFLPKTNAMEFAPQIHSPWELEEKLGKLLSFISKERLKVVNSKSKVAVVKTE
jgi:hypothetical protein